MGLIVLVRPGAPLGGIGILGLGVQELTGIRADRAPLGFDAAHFGTAYPVLGARIVVVSPPDAVIVTVGIAVDYRRDRCAGR